MNQKLKTAFWALLFLGLLILIIHGAKNNPEWRAFTWRGFVDHLVHVHPGYLLAAFGVSMTCYLVRALRWREFLHPVKRASVLNLWSAVVIGFMAVSVLGRAGELTRPFILARKERLSFSVSLTAIIMERLFDFSTVLTLFLVNLLFYRLAPSLPPQNTTVFHLFTRGAAILLAVFLSLTAVLFFFQRNAIRWIDFLIDRMWLIPHQAKIKIERMLSSFVDGLAFVAHPRLVSFSLGYSFLLWLLAVCTNYLVVRGFGVPFTFSMAVVLMAFSVFGSVVQLPGVGGGYQALTLYALVSFLGIKADVASGITLVAWVLAFIPVVGIGFFELLRGGMSLRSLTSDAEKEVATAFEPSSATLEPAQPEGN